MVKMTPTSTSNKHTISSNSIRNEDKLINSQIGAQKRSFSKINTAAIVRNSSPSKHINGLVSPVRPLTA